MRRDGTTGPASAEPAAGPPLRLVAPAIEHVERYADALRRGWNPSSLEPREGAAQLARLEADPVAFVAQQGVEQERPGRRVLPDGSEAVRLPGWQRWMLVGPDLVGSIGFRWQPGTSTLPPDVLGHIGYSVAPWARGRGRATSALRLMLAEASALGIPHVELVTEVENAASQRVIRACGGVEVERFVSPAAFGARPSVRWRIDLSVPNGPSTPDA